jgi:hypothetical protein
MSRKEFAAAVRLDPDHAEKVSRLRASHPGGLMTDEEIKAVVAKYIIGNHESDNADCLHEMDEWQTGEESEQDDLNKGYDFYRTARVTVTWE